MVDESSPEFDVQSMVDQAMAEAMDPETAQEEPATTAVEVPVLDGGGGNKSSGTNIELLGDVALDVKIELGRTHMLVEDVLKLGSGSVVELDKLAGDPVDVYVNKQLVARGEVLVLNDNFCIRISEIISELENQDEKFVGAVSEGDDGVQS